MDINELIRAFEKKTREKIISVTGKKPKPSKWQRLKCFIGFHQYDVKSGKGYFTDNQCIHCWSFRSENY